MADDLLGGQEGFFAKMTQSTTKFSAAVATFVTGVDAFRDVNSDFKDTAMKWGRTFSITAVLRATEQMASRYMQARVEVSRYFGVIGDQRQAMMGSLQSERSELVRYGATITDSLEAYKGIVDVTKNLNSSIRGGLVEASILMSKAFNMPAEAMGELAGQMSLFQGTTGEGLTDIFGTMARTAQETGISTQAVMENVRGAAHMMYLYNLRSQEGKDAFISMSNMATGLGVNLGSSVEAVQRFRRAGEAVSTSARLNVAGLNISGRQLMSAGMSGDPMKALLPALQQMQGMSENQRYFAANAMGDAVGMSVSEVMTSFQRAQDFGFDKLVDGSEKSLKELSNANMTFTDKLDSLLNVVTQGIVDPLIGPIVSLLSKVFGALDKVNETLLRSIAYPLGGIWLLMKTKLGSNIRGLFSGGMTQAVAGGGGGIYGGGGSNLPGMRNAPAGGMMGGMSASAMLKGAAAMVVMAGAVWVLGKALHNFAGLEWKTLGVAAGAIAGLVVVMAGLGAIMSSGIGGMAIVAGAGAFALLGTALAALGWGFQKMSEGIVPLLGHGQELLMLGPALMGIFSAMAFLPAAGFAGVIGGIFGSSMMKPLNELGEWAIEYSDPLNKAGEGMMKIADGLASLQNSNQLTSARTSSRSEGIPIENHITIQIGRDRLTDIIADSISGVK